MSDIFQEVDEAVLQDTALRRWNKAAPFVYVLIAALILGVAGWEVWKWQQTRQHKAESDAFFTARKAFEDGDFALAEALLGDIADSKSHYAAMSSHFLAQARLAGQGDKVGAIEAFKAAADGEGPFAQTARLKAAYLMADDMTVEELQRWLAPLTDNASSPYSFMAMEVVGARAFSLNDFETAKSQFNQISLSLDAPVGIRGRADRSLIAIDAIKAKNGTE